MKKTKWFPADVKPVHVGVYEIRHTALPRGFAMWDGLRWSHLMCERYEEPHFEFSPFQDKEWRGLAEKP